MLYLVPNNFCLCLESYSLPFFIPFPIHFPVLSLSAFHLVFSVIDNSPYQKPPAAQSLPAVTVPLYSQKLLFVKHKFLLNCWNPQKPADLLPLTSCAFCRHLQQPCPLCVGYCCHLEDVSLGWALWKGEEMLEFVMCDKATTQGDICQHVK